MLVVIGVAIAVTLFSTLDARQERVTRMAFEAEASDRVSVLKGRVQQIFEAVYGLAGFYQGSEEVTWEEFQALARPLLERHPGLKMLFWVPRVPEERRDAFEAFIPPVMEEPIKILEQTAEGELVAADERSSYFPVYYIWPVEEHDWLLGFDLASREETRGAMERARERDQVMATRPIVLVSDRDVVRSVWVFSAVERKPFPGEEVGPLEGFVGGAFRTDAMLRGIVPVFGPRDMILEIHDVEAPPDQNLIYASQNGADGDTEAATDAGSGLVAPGEHAARDFEADSINGDKVPMYTDIVEVAGRRWQILARPTGHYLDARETWTPLLLLVSGVGLSILLGFYLHTVLARRDQVERQVDERTEELRQEVERRRRYAEQLSETAEALRRSNRELEHFAYVASHDLQEPLRKVRGFGDMLRTEAGDALDDTAQDYLRRMRDAAGRMQALIQGLLTYSRVTTKAQPFERVDLDRIARQVVDDLAMRIRETGGQVHIDGLPEIQADPLQIRQLFQNLIGNGLKFHRKSVPPEVWVTGELLGDGSCRIQVRDNGIGFGPRETERLFKPFQRLHSRAEYEGTGMGLAVCQRIAERHGGSITADSAPGEGSTFTVVLPGRQAREEAHHAE